MCSALAVERAHNHLSQHQRSFPRLPTAGSSCCTFGSAARAARAPFGQIGVGGAAATAAAIGGAAVAEDLAGVGGALEDARRKGVGLRQRGLVLRLALQPPLRVLVQLLVRGDVALLAGFPRMSIFTSVV